MDKDKTVTGPWLPPPEHLDIQMSRQFAALHGVSLEEYVKQSEPVRQEDIVDEFIAPPPLRSLNS